jgi:hypothetical protein
MLHHLDPTSEKFTERYVLLVCLCILHNCHTPVPDKVCYHIFQITVTYSIKLDIRAVGLKTSLEGEC